MGVRLFRSVEICLRCCRHGVSCVREALPEYMRCVFVPRGFCCGRHMYVVCQTIVLIHPVCRKNSRGNICVCRKQRGVRVFRSAGVCSRYGSREVSCVCEALSEYLRCVLVPRVFCCGRHIHICESNHSSHTSSMLDEPTWEYL